MKGRAGWWIALALFCVLVLQEVNVANCKQIKCGRPTRSINDEHKDEESDLEGSETSYTSSFSDTTGYHYDPQPRTREAFTGYPYTNNLYTNNPYTNNPYTSNPYTSNPYISNPYTSNPRTENPYNFQNAINGGNATTSIHQQIACGDAFPRTCRNSRYRTFDGSCNNRQNPTWGMANTRFQRLLPPNYSDGIRGLTISVTGTNLPLARLVSFTLFPHVDVDDPVWTLATMQWGQIITHDMSMIDGTSQARPHKIRCCTNDRQLIRNAMLHGHCNAIVIPPNDPVYVKANVQCLNFVRSTTDIDHGCTPPYKPAEQLSTVTHYLDLSIVYGSNDQLAARLRAGIGGRMNVEIRYNKEWPPAAFNKTDSCSIRRPEESCYLGGDERINQSPQLTLLQIILLREHNRVADVLARMNPHWTDETTFQEARRILIAEHQHISYYEWLPIFLGTKGTYGNRILYETNDFVNDYDPTVNPSVLNGHANAAFRYFHTLIAGYLQLVDDQRGSNGAIRISDTFNRPGVLEEYDIFDDLTRGLSFQSGMNSDKFFDKEITLYLFRNRNRLGTDLRAIDIQRNRDHGLASYNDYREFCGLPRARVFSDFSDYISPLNVQKLADLYASPDDVEVTVGGSLEQHEHGTFAGPTFLCILTRQFYRTRVGDRFWYENNDRDHGFTLAQLNEIRKSSLARLFCDNGNHIRTMQRSAFKRVSQRNPITNCENIPSIDLSLWKDNAQYSNQPNVGDYPYKK